MIKIFKYFVLVFVLLNFNHQVQAKPVPPGSGEGDVPANILLLLDSSASMDLPVPLFTGDKFIEFDSDFGTEGLVYIQQPQALPMTILGIYPRLETESV